MIIDDTCRCGSTCRITCTNSIEANFSHKQWLEAHEVCRQPSKPRRLTYDDMNDAISQLKNQTQPPATDIVGRIRSNVRYFRYFILPKFICRVVGHRFVPVDMTMTWRKNYGQTYCCLRCYAESASDKKLIEVILD